VCERFLEEWNKQGSEQSSIYVNGLPITARRPEISMEDGKLYDTQWFERARYELHPENKAPFDVLLGRLGYSIAEGRGKIVPATGKAANPADQPFVGIDKPADADGKTKVWFQETRHTISGKVLEYWNKYGGLPQFGYPLSEPMQEVSQADGKLYTVQYFERNRMELHPEKPAPYDVELGLLGVEQYRLQAIAADQLPVAPARDVKTSKDTIIIGLGWEPSNLTFADTSSPSRRIRALIEDGLVGRDDNDNLFPLNAWYVPTLENGGARFIGEGEDRYLQVKYKLRQGIKWSDGKELTSNDAVFAYKLMLDPRAPVPNRSEYQKLQNIDNPDKYTIIYNYRSYRQVRDYYSSIPNKQDFGFLRPFVDLKKPVVSRSYSEIGVIYPEHVLGKIAPDKITTSDVAGAPVGTGPWKVQSWHKFAAVVLVPNEHYSLTVPPAIKTIRIRFYTDFNTAGSSHVKTGEVHLVTEMFNQPPADRHGIEGAGYKIAGRPATSWEQLGFQLEYAPFKEKAVREAIISGINRQHIADVIYQGLGGVMNSVIPPSVYFSLEHPDFARKYPDIAAKYRLPAYPFDPDKAVRLLEGAGWKCSPGVADSKSCDGTPREKGGPKLSFEYGTTNQFLRQQMQRLVSADLKAIGIHALPKSYDSSTFFGPNSDIPRDNGITKLAQFPVEGTRDSDFEDWLCDARNHSPGVSNDTLSCLDHRDLYDANTVFNAHIDPVMQLSAATQAQTLLMTEITSIPLVLRPNVEVVTNALANYKLPNSQVSSFWNARQWYFK
jgi:peptide/nickel transport system substrate-binding protein